MRASLKYVLPTKLDGEVLIATKIAVNSVPNRKTGPGTTPYQIVSGKKVTPQPFKMGEIGLVNARREDTPDLRAEHGIFLYSELDLPGSMKIYVPHRKHVYSKRTFEIATHYPAEWLLNRRLIDVRTDDTLGEVRERLPGTTTRMLVGYDESMNVMTTKGAEHQRLGNVLQEEIKRQSISRSSRVMREDDMVQSIARPSTPRPTPEVEVQDRKVEQLDHGVDGESSAKI